MGLQNIVVRVIWALKIRDAFSNDGDIWVYRTQVYSRFDMPVSEHSLFAAAAVYLYIFLSRIFLFISLILFFEFQASIITARVDLACCILKQYSLLVQ